MSILARLLARIVRPPDVDLRSLYLQLLIDSLLNEIYLENEARLLYVFTMMSTGQPIDEDTLRRISSRLPDLVDSVRAAKQTGRIWWRVKVNDKMLDLRNVCHFSHTMAGRKRLNNVVHCLDVIRQDGIDGDLAETGVWRGGVCILMRGYLKAWGMDRSVWVADSFEGMPKPSLLQDQDYDYSAELQPILAVSLEEVQDNFGRYGLLDERVRFVKGWFRDTLSTAPIDKLALLRLDGDLYESTMDALNALYHKVEPGGFVIIDDYGDFEPCRKAVHEFRDRHSISDTIERIDWTGCYWRKS